MHTQPCGHLNLFFLYCISFQRFAYDDKYLHTNGVGKRDLVLHKKSSKGMGLRLIMIVIFLNLLSASPLDRTNPINHLHLLCLNRSINFTFFCALFSNILQLLNLISEESSHSFPFTKSHIHRALGLGYFITYIENNDGR